MVVVLVGFMGAGKTTVGHMMAERLGQPFVDSDVLIEQRLGRDIRDIFRTEGEPYFRQLEHDTVAGLVRGQDAVIALGGGAVEDPRSRAVLRNARALADMCGVSDRPESAVVSVLLGDPEVALAAATACLDRGVRVGCFRPPTVPVGTSRLRLTARASMTADDLSLAERVLTQVLTAARR